MVLNIFKYVCSITIWKKLGFDKNISKLKARPDLVYHFNEHVRTAQSKRGM